MTEILKSWCRHCGVAATMTREHVPPRSAGNTVPINRVADPFDQDAAVTAVAEWSEGHTVSTLCEACNARASRWGYVAEYRRWHETFAAVARSHAAEHDLDPLIGHDPFEIELPYDLHPARFARQVLGMFLAVQNGPTLLSDHPHLATLIDADPDDITKRRTKGLPIAPLHLTMAVDNGPYAYLAAPALAVSIAMTSSSSGLRTPPGSRSSHSSLIMMRFAPFAFFLADRDPHPGLDITHWTTWQVDQRLPRAQRRLKIPTVNSLGTITAAMLHPRATHSDTPRGTRLDPDTVSRGALIGAARRSRAQHDVPS